MQKFYGFILTFTLGCFAFLCFELEEHNTVNYYVPTHDIQNNHGINTTAITVNTFFDVLMGFEEHQNQPSVNHFYTTFYLKKIFLKLNFNRLKTCASFYFDQTIGVLIFPFHSFL